MAGGLAISGSIATGEVVEEVPKCHGIESHEL
jgi:hypothetical protein